MSAMGRKLPLADGANGFPTGPVLCSNTVHES
jgi:hypothetical protein